MCTEYEDSENYIEFRYILCFCVQSYNPQPQTWIYMTADANIALYYEDQ